MGDSQQKSSNGREQMNPPVRIGNAAVVSGIYLAETIKRLMRWFKRVFNSHTAAVAPRRSYTEIVVPKGIVFL